MSKIAAGVLGAALAVSVAANALMYTRYSSSRPMLRMENGSVVTRKDFRDALDYQYGKPVLQKLVYTKLVNDAAKKAGLMPTDADVEKRIEQVSRTQTAMVEAARRDPSRMAQLKDDVKTDLALENLRIKDIDVTPAEVRSVYDRFGRYFATPGRVDATSVVSGNRVDASSAEEMLRQDIAPDVIARQPRLRVVGVGGYVPDLSGLKPEEVRRLQQAMYAAKAGEIRTVAVGGGFLTFRIKQQGRAGVLPFEKVKAEATRLAKLEKAPGAQEELARLYNRANVTFEMNQYAGYFDDLPKVPVAKPRQTASAR
jgi:hypothetical protein